MGRAKSTLLEVIAGVHRPRRGTVSAVGAVGLVVQTAHTPPTLPLTVRDAVAAGRWRIPRPRSAMSVPAALDRVGLTDLVDRPHFSLSGGQRQRTMLAQAIIAAPDLLLLDEPATGLDAESQHRIAKVLGEETARGAIVICVTHVRASIAAADRVLTLVDGRLAQ